MKYFFSVIIPVFNEELVLNEFYPRLKKEAESWGKSYELLFVDDGRRIFLVYFIFIERL